MALPNLLYTCVYFIPCFACSQGCLPMALDESFRHAPTDIDRDRDRLCSLQLLSGIWLCYRLNSSHELVFSCSHPNAFVSFFYEAPSQRKVAVPSFCLPNCHIRELLRMLALCFHMTYLSIWAQIWDVSIALIELFAQFRVISWPNLEISPGPCPIIPVQHIELDSESCIFPLA